MFVNHFDLIISKLPLRYKNSTKAARIITTAAQTVMIAERMVKRYFFSSLSGRSFARLRADERGLYMIDALGCVQDKDFVHKLLVRLHLSKDAPNALQEMLNRNIIVWVYSLKDMFVESVWDDDKETFEKHFDNLPYFVFSQHFLVQLYSLDNQ